MHSSHAGQWLPRVYFVLILSFPVLATAIFLRPASVQAPSPPSGKAPLEILVEGFRAPTGVAVGPDGTLFFADEKEGDLFQRDPDGNLVLLADNLKSPRGLVRAEDGTLFLVAEGLRKGSGDPPPKGLLLQRSLDGTLTIVASGFRGPRQLTLDRDNHPLLSTSKGRRDPSQSGQESKAAKDENDEEEDEDPEGDADEEAEKVRTLPGTIFRVSSDGTILQAHAGFLRPSGLAIAEDGTIIVAARGFKREAPLLKGSLFRISPNSEVTVLLQDRLQRPRGLVQDGLGQFYLGVSGHPESGTHDGLLLKVAPEGTYTVFAQGFERPWGLTLDTQGNLYVSDRKTGRIYRFRAPPAPTLADHATATNQPKITIKGASEPEARITVKGGQEDASTFADTQGNFAVEVSLKPDQPNTLKVYATAAKGEGLTGPAATTTIIQDTTAPTVTFLRPVAGSQITGITTVEITADDTLSGIATVEFLVDGALRAIRTDPPFTFLLDPAAFAPGPHTLTARALDRAGNVASASIPVEFGLLPPTLTSFEPTSGKVGAPVTLTGTRFDPNASGNTVTFNGVPAEVLSVSSTQLFAKVPTGATTGPIAVRTAGGTATSTGHFIVLPSQDFTLNVAPATAQVVQGSQVSFVISAAGQEGFAGVVSLAAASLPTGLTGTLSQAQIGPGGTATLTVNAAVGATPGAAPITITGTSIIDGKVVGHQQIVNVSVLGGGITALTGRVLDTDNKPVQGVTLTLAGRTAKSDGGGNFLLQDVPAGANQFLFIDGSTAVPDRKYPTFPALVTLEAGKVNVLPFTPFLHPQKATGFVDISNSGVERVVTDPGMPGLELRIPAGVTITGWDGQPNTKISVSSVPLDRIPLPHPDPPIAARSVYFFYFDKVGGGTPSQPVPFTAPNDLGLPPGAKTELWYYDEGPTPGSATQRWQKAGIGTVSADGKTISTDPGVGLPRFCCGAACFACATGQCNPAENPRRDGSTQSTDPVDLNSGVFVYTKTDMVLPGRLPITITRTYRTLDTTSGVFGIGWSGNFDIALRRSGNQITLVLPGNTGVPFTLQPDGSFAALSDPGHRGSRITVAADGSATLRFKDSTRWTFGPFIGGFTQLGSMIDRHGNTVTVSRDSIGRITALTEPGGRRILFEYAAAFGPISRIADPLGRGVQYEYDAQGRLTRVTDPNGGVTRYTYDDQHRMVSITDPRNITFSTNIFGTSGRAIRQLQADGGETRFAYMLSGAQVRGTGCPGPTCPEVESVEATQQGFTFSGGFVVATTVTDPKGNRTVYRFNNFGDLIEQVDTLGQSTKFERAFDTNLLLSTTDPLGRVTRFTYDANGNVTTITDPAGNARTLEYEPTFNKLTKITDPLGNVTQFAYDANGNLIKITDPLGNMTQIAYNQFGQPVSTTDPLGNVTQFQYDTVGNLVTITDPLGNSTTRTYDLVSRLIAQTDPRGKSTEFRYDDLNRITQVVDALNNATAFSYDGNGNLLTVTDTRGSVTEHTYDSMDRLATRTDPLGRDESYQYDPNGNLTQFTDRKNQVSSFTYDGLNRRTRSAFEDGSFTEFTFDTAGRLTRASDSQTGTIVEEYDTLDRLIRETTPQGTISYAYDPLGRRTTMTVDGQSPVGYTYDAASRLRTITQAPLNPVTIDYDALGRRTLLTLPNVVSTEYQYDIASRLTALIYRNAAGPLGDLAYEYDPAGNRVGVGGSFARTLLPDPVLSSTYDAANQQLAFGDKAMTFDANGNLTSTTDPSGATTFTWDARNRLTALSGSAVSASFVYDALARRSARQINGQLSEYLYDAFDVTREVLDGIAVEYLRNVPIDESLCRIQTGEPSCYIADVLSSNLALAGSSGNINTTYTYDPFGRTATAGLSSANPFQYTGREHDAQGLYYYRARYYSAPNQRFISPDPLLCGQTGSFPLATTAREPQSLNPYAYVQNAPIDRTDPLGLTPNCSYYDRRCGEIGRQHWLDRAYFCYAGRFVCKVTGENCFSGSVRPCLQLFDQERCAQGSGRKNPAFECYAVSAHEFCFQLGIINCIGRAL